MYELGAWMKIKAHSLQTSKPENPGTHVQGLEGLSSCVYMRAPCQLDHASPLNSPQWPTQWLEHRSFRKCRLNKWRQEGGVSSFTCWLHVRLWFRVNFWTPKVQNSNLPGQWVQKMVMGRSYDLLPPGRLWSQPPALGILWMTIPNPSGIFSSQGNEESFF